MIQKNVNKLNTEIIPGYYNKRKIDILLSYGIPVAYKIKTRYKNYFFITDKFYSIITSKHIKNFIQNNYAVKKSQQFFNNLKKYKKSL